MMKRGLVVLAFAIVLSGILVAPASAYYYMTYNQAKHSTRELVIEVCEGIASCRGFGVGGCFRDGPAAFTCFGALFYEGVNFGEEEECNRAVHWGVRNGYIHLNGYGAANCFAV